MVSKLKLAPDKKSGGIGKFSKQVEGSGNAACIFRRKERMIVEKCIFAARRGFALDDENLKIIMSCMAQDGRSRGWKEESPALVQ